LRSKEIMDAVESGQSFTVTREGRGIAELVPLRQVRTFVSRETFAATSRQSPPVDLATFRADQHSSTDVGMDDPYAR